MVRLHTGENSLTVYAFGEKNGLHKFCRVCGTSVMIHAATDDMMALNVSEGFEFEENAQWLMIE